MTQNLIHGGDIYSLLNKKKYNAEQILDFSANINPLGLPEGVKKAVREGLEEAIHYPDPLCRKLIKELATYEKVDEGYLICGNGAADLIFRLAYFLKPKRALLLAPTFAEYEIALQAVGCTCEYHFLKEEEGFEVGETLLEALDEQYDVLFLCNPNNPTGQVIDQKRLLRLLDKCCEKNILLVVDECFNDFLEEPEAYSLKEWVSSCSNLFILKAFTKLYAMPGIRLGYGMTSHSTLLEGMGAVGQPWSVSTVAQQAGIAALQEEAYRQQTKPLILEGRTYLIEELRGLDMQVIEGKANYLLFKSPYQMDLKGALEAQGILIRSCSNYRGLNNTFYRIAVKDQEANKQLIEALTKIVTSERRR